MKRFWKIAEVVPQNGASAVQLDGKPLKTPMRDPLVVPTEALAGAIAEEWNSVGEQIDPHRMVLTGLANAAIDRVRPDSSAFAAGLVKYAEADLVCYRAEGPRELVAKQAQSWDPLLAWARDRFDADFRITNGIMHVDQPEATVHRLGQAVDSLDEFRLAALSPLVTIGGSLIAALAVLEGEVPPDEAWNAVTVDERWQIDQWGTDAEAEERLENRRRDFLAAAAFLELLSN